MSAICSVKTPLAAYFLWARRIQPRDSLRTTKYRATCIQPARATSLTAKRTDTALVSLVMQKVSLRESRANCCPPFVHRPASSSLDSSWLPLTPVWARLWSKRINLSAGVDLLACRRNASSGCPLGSYFVQIFASKPWVQLPNCINAIWNTCLQHIQAI